jgi:Zn-dependent protease
MRYSIQLFRIREISVRVHATFPLILLLVAILFGFYSGANLRWIGISILVTLLLFVIVFLHELAHSLAAQHYGIKVEEIVLLPIGGIAKLANNPEEPHQELVIASAGPAINLILAGVLFLGSMAASLFFTLDLRFDLRYDVSHFSPGGIAGYLILSNLFLAVFNLIPAFPLDGGRMLRGILSFWLERASATKLAAVLGQVIALMMILWGFFLGAYYFTLIGIFIFLAARQEDLDSGFTEQIESVTVDQIIKRDYFTLEPYCTLREAIMLIMHTQQKSIPVSYMDYYHGLLTQRRLIDAIEGEHFYMIVRNFIRTDIEVARMTDRVVDIRPRLSYNDVDILPVVEDGKFIGVVTVDDVAEVFSFKRRIKPAGNEEE